MSLSRPKESVLITLNRTPFLIARQRSIPYGSADRGNLADQQSVLICVICGQTVRALTLHRPPQALPRAVQPKHDGAARYIQAFRYFVVGQFVDVPHRDDLALRLADAGHALDNPIAQLAQARFHVGTAALRGEIYAGIHQPVEGGLAAALAFLDVVEAGVSNDAVEPGEEGPVRIEARHGPVGLHKGLLRNFERVLTVSHKAIGDGVGAPLVNRRRRPGRPFGPERGRSFRLESLSSSFI